MSGVSGLEDVALVERVTGCRLTAITGRRMFHPDAPRPAPVVAVEKFTPVREGEPVRMATGEWPWLTIVELCRRIEAEPPEGSAP
jgi:hypothetical protein